MSKKIYILGAGASKGHTNGDFPTIYEFFKVANKLNILTVNGKKLKIEYKDLGEYISENFNLNILKQDINIEEVMTNLEIDIEKSDSYELIILRNKIISIIRNTLNKLSEKSFCEDSEYNIFYKMINNNDTILTYNWDILLDNILGREIVVPDYSRIDEAEKSGKQQYKNMWEKLTAVRDLKWHTEIPYVNYQSEGYYLKLHGSIDWAYCTNRDCGSYSKVFAVDRLNEKHYCFECGSEVQYLIVPPVLNKNFRNIPFMKKVWNFARNEMSNADEIVIWGYSLPPTDFYSKWLFRQSKEKLKSVSIINPACYLKVKRKNKFDYQRNLKQFLNPFIELFEHKVEKNKLEYYENFTDYYNNVSFNKKYNIEK